MSRYGLISILLAIFLAMLVVPVVGMAQNATSTNLTEPGTALVNVSPVVPVSCSTGISIADATDINYSAYSEIYGTSPHVSVITAQLYLNGKPYNRSNIPITFTSDNDSVAVLESLDRTRPSDEHGQAKILLISNNTVGMVNITASSKISYSHEIKDTCSVWVVGWGTVSGFVTDKNKNGVPNAKVTLWVWNGTSNVGVLRAPDNPQLTNDGSTAAIGTYTYSRVPKGTYNLTAEKDGHVYFAMVYMNVGTYTANVAFPDYVYPALITPTPTPEPVITPVPSEAPTTVPTAASSSGLTIPGMGAMLTVLALVASLGIAAIALKK
ncbi:carboxypeptidase regulatory-like domain-containing protein [Methanocella sp. MCL-LM]|uniref:carboxypeptidase-like regulatory domain-containing protein n=1 Tax=Methanocella sp. MCL-LM TaxID=3412035 RepID=UPI003C71734E